MGLVFFPMLGFFSLYDSPHEFEPSNDSANDYEAPFANEVASNGYSRTRKNLKDHLVEQKKLDSDSEDDTSEVMRPNPSRTFSKAARKIQNSPPAFLPNGSHKNIHVRRINKEDTHVSSDSKISKSPVVVIERMPRNLCVDSVSSNFKTRLSMLDMVQRLSMNRKREISETSPSPKVEKLASPSIRKVISYAGKCNIPEYISPEMSANFKKNVVANETKDLSKSKANYLGNGTLKILNDCIDKRESDSLRNEPLIEEESLHDLNEDSKLEKLILNSATATVFGFIDSEANVETAFGFMDSETNIDTAFGFIDSEANIDEGLECVINDDCNVSDVLDTPSPVAKKRRPDTPLPKVAFGHSLDTPSRVAQNQRPDTPLLKIATNKRSLSYDRSLNIIKRPRVYPKCDSSGSDVNGECSLARSNEKSLRPTQNSLAKDTPLNNCTNSKTSTGSVENVSKQEPFTFLQKESNSHTCTKQKLLQVPILVCDCSHSNSTNNTNNLMPSLTAHVSKFASTIANIVKQNPDNFQALPSSHINAFCDSVKRLFLQNSCELFDVHPSTATNALDSNTKDDKCQAFIDNAFNLHKECSYKMMTFFTHNLDLCKQLTVKHFCSNPNVVRFMSEFFSRSDKFSRVSVNENNFLYKFPKNDESPFCIVVKDYARYFVKRIWPLGSKQIANSLIMEYALKNMSNVEIIIVSIFFLQKELLTLKAFIARFTYVAVLSTYKYYSMMNK